MKNNENKHQKPDETAPVPPRYHLDYQHPKDYGNIRLVQVGRLYCDSRTVIGKHLHLNWFELTIVTDGKGTLSTNDVEIPIKRGDMYLSLPAEVHGIRSDADAPLKYDFFSFFTEKEEYAAQLEQVMQCFKDPTKRLFSDEKIRQLVQNSISEFSKPGQFLSDELLAHTFELILVYLLRNFPLSSTKDPLWFDNADRACYYMMNYIDTHVFSLKHLEELAEVTHYNYSYLSSLFRKTTGRTLLDYYASCRLRMAHSLVLEGNLRIGEIATLLNYSSVYSLSKAYKKKYGVSPTETRQAKG
jgi:AraC-like DNA-binding protein/mannose-6-phosphate isomerase-like protein (cupin superfamily)